MNGRREEEVVRFRSLARQISEIKEAIYDNSAVEVSQAREMRKLLVSDIDRAKNEDRLFFPNPTDNKKRTTKLRCGCCHIEFYNVNLPLKVSQKAILDIRVKWSGGLTSSTVFGKTSEVDDTGKN